MKTTKEMIEVLQSYERGERISWASKVNNAAGDFDKAYFRFENHQFDFMHNDYRIAPSFILVNGIKVPEPCRVMPEAGERYYLVSVAAKDGFHEVFVNHAGADPDDLRILNRGIMHLTEEAARQHYEAIISTSKQK